jgi:hypothetical protein
VKLTKKKLTEAVKAQLVALFRLIEDVTGVEPDRETKLLVLQVATALPYNRQYKIYRQSRKLISAIVIMSHSQVFLMPMEDLIQALLVSSEEDLNKLINEGYEPVEERLVKEG